MLDKVDHFAFAVANVDRAAKFYQEILGLSLLFVEEDATHGEKFAFLQAEGCKLELLGDLMGKSLPKPQNFMHRPHLAFAVPDIDAFSKRLRNGKIPFEGPYHIPEKVAWLYFKDPDGNSIEACQWFG